MDRVATPTTDPMWLGSIPMFGRETERTLVLGALADPSCRLVTVTGRGGVGKTRLAAEVVRSLVEQSGPPVAVVPLAGVTDTELVLPEIAASLAVPALATFDVVDAIARHLHGDEVVLVLDNFEHVLAAAGCVAELLDRCAGLTVLVTSQAPLRLRHERVVRVDPLPLPVPGHEVTDADVLLTEPAVAMYCERAAAVDRHFRLDRGNAAAVADLCRGLEGLPLAIELAAARAATLPAVEIVRRLDDRRLTLLRRARDDAPARHHDLHAAIAWTYDLLKPEEQEFLRRLSVVSGTFGIELAEGLADDGTVAPDAIEGLSALVDLHLVDPVPSSDPARFLIPPSIRAFAAELLHEHGEDHGARRLHVSLRAGDARAAAKAMDTADETSALEFLASEHDDLFAALQQAVDLRLVDEALDLAVGLAARWDVTGFHRAHEEQLERTLDLAADAESPGARHAHALAWSALLGVRHGGTVDRAVLLDRLEHCEALARSTDDVNALLRTLEAWMRIFPYTGDVRRAERAAAEGLELANRGDDNWLGRFQALAGMLAHQTGDDAEAAALGRGALMTIRRRPSNRTVVLATMLLRPLVVKYPDLGAEVPTTEEALRLARSSGLALYESLLLPTLVLELATEDTADRALPWAAESARLARSLPGTPIVSYNLLTTTALASVRGDDTTAAVLCGAVRRDFEFLAPTLAPENVDRLERAFDRARTALGDETFEAHALRGQTLDGTEALEFAMAYLHESLAGIGEVTVPATPAATTGESDDFGLTRRQREVLRLLAAGLSNREIAERLGVSPKTVMHHTGAIYRTLGVRGRGEAIATAVRSGLAY